MLVSDKNFNNIKIHTQYSICEGAIKIDELAEYCKTNKIKSFLSNFFEKFEISSSLTLILFSSRAFAFSTDLFQTNKSYLWSFRYKIPGGEDSPTPNQ